MKKKRGRKKKSQCRRQEDGNERAKGELRGETKKRKKKGFITKQKKKRGEQSVRRGAGELTGEGRRADNP